MFTSISNPALTFPSIAWSNFFIIQADKGPIIIAPINIGISAPTITPIVAIAPITPPLSPCTIFPPVYAINSGSKNVDIGDTNAASLSFGAHPVSMNKAVISPHAINAPITGITIPLRKRPIT